MALSVPAVALANNGPHGGYAMNTEACAGCHRAHTAPSTITWVDLTLGGGRTRSALLLTTATNLEAFCLACHDSQGQGALTNVVEGLYYGLPGDPNGAADGDLISGAFGRQDVIDGVPMRIDGNGHKVSSVHITSGGSWGAYGGGTFASTATDTAHANGTTIEGMGNTEIFMDCGTCHDPHGSSNYRILKDYVYGVPVGGYASQGPGSLLDPDPTAFVISKEQGFPIGGFRLHLSNADIGYVPNYTVAQYSVPPTSVASPTAPDPLRGMSGWCTGCHTTYMTEASQYDAGDGFGFTHLEGEVATATIRHRHPINVELSTFQGPRPLNVDQLRSRGVPLAHRAADTPGAPSNVAAQGQTMDDWVECLTCHNAHGASSEMTGAANVAPYTFDPSTGQLQYEPNSGTGGVPPLTDSALLRLDNRSACEVCHWK
jgi:nitrate reductase cytochrome c-type subunit